MDIPHNIPKTATNVTELDASFCITLRLIGEKDWLKSREVVIRIVTEITKENIFYSKKLSEVVELRHLDGIRSSFGVAVRKEYLDHVISEQEEPLSHAIVSNVKQIVEAKNNIYSMSFGIKQFLLIRESEKSKKE